MSLSSSSARALQASMLCAALLAASGCSWMHRPDGSLKFLPRSQNSDYKLSKENRPLEVPPDLDTPATDPSMQIPASHGPAMAAMSSEPSGAFTISDNPAGAWERMGKALERIDGVTITSRSQLLNSYEVQYKGASMLLQASPDGGSTHIDAVGADGKPVRTQDALQLLNLLHDRIG